MNNKNMSVIAYANGWTMWCYNDFDCTLEKIFKPKFFDKIHTLCAVGDIIMIVAQDGTADAVIVSLKDKHVTIKTKNVVKFED